MLVVGLTGSIGMGKSTVAAMLRARHVPVYDADAAVHRLLAPGGKAYLPVSTAYPDCLTGGLIDRKRLGNQVFGSAERLNQLEEILHPLVAADRVQFLRRCRSRRIKLVVLDIPLLFEKSLEAETDVVLTVSAPRFVQRARVLARPGMTETKFAAIMVRQMPDLEKRRRSDYVIKTGGPRSATVRRLQTILKALESAHA